MRPQTALIARTHESALGEVAKYRERTETIVHLAPTVRGRVYTLRGVPKNRVDVVVTDDAWTPRDDRDDLIVEVSLKQGRYDGQQRDRILFRRLPGHQARHLPMVSSVVTHGSSSSTVEVEVGAWTRTYRALRSSLDGYRLARIVMWHWRRYYTHLEDGDAVRALADEWAVISEAEASNWTLAEANRSAARCLYRYSRDAGWRKLTTREREKLGAPAMWVRQEWVAAQQLGRGDATGAGEYTLRSARVTP